MRAPRGDRLNVRRFENRQCLLMRDRAPPLVCIGNENAKRALSKTLKHWHRPAPDCIVGLRNASSGSRPQSVHDLLP